MIFFNDTATTEIYTLSLHDALPISLRLVVHGLGARDGFSPERQSEAYTRLRALGLPVSDRFEVLDDLEGVWAYIERYREQRHSVEHEIDGVVVKVDQVALQRRLG